jgi:hypothetical protein
MNFNIGKQECLEKERNWIIPIHNYENLYEAIQSLLVISTLDAWGVIF